MNIRDSIIAIFIDPVGRGRSIAKLTRLARLIDVIERVANADESLNDPGSVSSASSKSLLLPDTMFPIRPDLPKPVGVGDLLVVKQHIKRYELGEIANVENILRGESRQKSTKHNLTLDRTIVTETETSAEKKETRPMACVSKGRHVLRPQPATRR